MITIIPVAISLGLCAQDSAAAHGAWRTTAGTITQREAVAGAADEAYRPDTVVFTTETGQRRSVQVLLDWHRPMNGAAKVYYHPADSRFKVRGDMGPNATQDPWPSIAAHVWGGLGGSLALFLTILVLILISEKRRKAVKADGSSDRSTSYLSAA